MFSSTHRRISTVFFLHQLVAFESLSQNPSMEFREKENHRLKQRSLGGDMLVAGIQENSKNGLQFELHLAWMCQRLPFMTFFGL